MMKKTKSTKHMLSIFNDPIRRLLCVLRGKNRRRPDRLSSVLAVLYLVFNEGYKSSKGNRIHDTQLCHEAIRLARMLHTLMPDTPEIMGFLINDADVL